MEILTLITIFLLIIIALIHFYWSFGGKVGIDLAIPSIEDKAVINPTKFITFLVGILIIGFATVAYMLKFHNLNSNYIIYLGWIISIIFALRAIGEFRVVGFFKKIKSSKFAKYDTKYYSPLCLFFSVIFVILTFS